MFILSFSFSLTDLTAVLDNHRGWFPEKSDLTGAIDAIFRVQEVFNIKAMDLSNDLVPSMTRGYLMEAGDAFTIGKRAYVKEQFKHSKKWLEVALTLWEKGRRSDDDDIIEILDYLSFVEFKVRRQNIHVIEQLI